jgi:hypothetical protein
MTTPATTDRAAFRAAVAEIAAKASARLPDSLGRIDSAVKLVLAGDVELLPEGGARVASRSAANVTYYTANGACECKDSARAPGHLSRAVCSSKRLYGAPRGSCECERPCDDPRL